MGLGTDVFPEDTFWPVQNFIMKSLENEDIIFVKFVSTEHFLKTMRQQESQEQECLRNI